MSLISGCSPISATPSSRFGRRRSALPTIIWVSWAAGIQQHRHHLAGAVLKMNHVRDPLPAMPPAGFHELQIVVDGVSEAQALTDPDGNHVTLLPRANATIKTYGLVIQVNNPARHAQFFTQALGFVEIDPNVFQHGTARIILHAASTPISSVTDWCGPEFRYITLQVKHARAAFESALAAGATLGQPIRELGDLVRFGFIRDPDGNWIEISERTSFTGRSLS